MTRTAEAFPDDYADGRRRFLAAAEAAGAEVASHPHPLRGPAGEPLSSDLAWLGPRDARRVLVTLSGTHGVEGFAGSGIQTGALRAGSYRSLPDDTAVALVHAVTPHGFAWLRRANEDGVDVCRNFVDFAKPLPENPFYDRFARDLVPEDWRDRAAADARLWDYVREHGVRRFTAELARGQYAHAFAPFFGGRAPSWSNRTLRGILRARLARAREVAVLDYHTGLGDWGSGQVIGIHPPGDPRHGLGVACWGEKFVSLASEDSVAYDVTGDILRAIYEELPGARVTAGAYEFGTVDPVQVIGALRADHWLHAHGDLDSPRAREIQDGMRAAFYGDADAWRERVFELALAAEHEALAMLAEI